MKTKKILPKTGAEENLPAIIKEQSERLQELRRENADLLLVLEDYRSKEKEIADTLNFARKQREEVLKTVRVRCALECERLKAFRQKWETAVTDENSAILAVKKTRETLTQCQREMERMIADDLGEDMSSYLEERDRLEDEPQLNYSAIIGESDEDLENRDRLTEEELRRLLEQI